MRSSWASKRQQLYNKCRLEKSWVILTLNKAETLKTCNYIYGTWISLEMAKGGEIILFSW